MCLSDCYIEINNSYNILKICDLLTDLVSAQLLRLNTVVPVNSYDDFLIKLTFFRVSYARPNVQLI
jgi:hypothetical protein